MRIVYTSAHTNQSTTHTHNTLFSHSLTHTRACARTLMDVLTRIDQRTYAHFVPPSCCVMKGAPIGIRSRTYEHSNN